MRKANSPGQRELKVAPVLCLVLSMVQRVHQNPAVDLGRWGEDLPEGGWLPP